MFDIRLNFKNVEISSVEKEDLDSVYKWFINGLNCNFDKKQKPLTQKQFYEMFLAYYLSECEFFLKVERKKETIGIVKGAIEFKNPNQVWLKWFFINEQFRNEGVGTEILKKIINYFYRECRINDFYIKVPKCYINILQFFKKNDFKLIGFSNEKNQYQDKVMILKK
ncbi:GNAT family N-acetyltransferase [Clostridium aestuarii]|uniref:GNAT family N-acetyltransferase n=1 Tax=Clostridium aestuarii TaxID=338193 RepID=A0ABT4D1T3_9CLOT|nr:GNAT family N-acetyltransferase [Clostridium aestuarii]MCY6485067.1 GNAT family N-acetyltransferase [Clostridium aestuarii]